MRRINGSLSYERVFKTLGRKTLAIRCAESKVHFGRQLNRLVIELAIAILNLELGIILKGKSGWKRERFSI